MARTIRMSLIAASVIGLFSGLAKPTQAAPSKPAAPAAPATVSEPAIATPGPVGDYLRRMHDRLHGRWNDTFVKTVASTYSPIHPFNNLSRETTVELTIRWDGTVAEATTKKVSGSPEFDRAALDIARKSAPYPLPTPDVVSDDSYAHVEWTFARNHRGCSAGASVARVDDPLDVSLPKLVQTNRIGEALRRVGDALKAGNDTGMDRFARLYLGRTGTDPVLNVVASLALVDAGDRRQAPRLRQGLASPPAMELAVRGLRRVGADICEATRETMTSGKAPTRELAVAAVRFAAREGSDISACLSALTTLASDTTQPTAARVLALDSIITLLPASARPVVMGRVDDKDPAVRGVALLASVKKGGGRPEMYRLAPLLHHKAVEVRAAASAGMVRAGGDMALEQLYLLSRETDPRPGQGVVAELAQMSSKPSAEFLGKMLKRNNGPVQAAAARALVARRDGGARAEREIAKADSRLPADVQAIFVGKAKPDTKPTVVAAPTADAAATEPVRALLKESHTAEAAAWIVEKLPSLEPRDAIAVLGAWLVRGPASAGKAPGAAPEDAAPKGPAPAATKSATSALAM